MHVWETTCPSSNLPLSILVRRASLALGPFREYNLYTSITRVKDTKTDVDMSELFGYMYKLGASCLTSSTTRDGLNLLCSNTMRQHPLPLRLDHHKKTNLICSLTTNGWIKETSWMVKIWRSKGEVDGHEQNSVVDHRATRYSLGGCPCYN